MAREPVSRPQLSALRHLERANAHGRTSGVTTHFTGYCVTPSMFERLIVKGLVDSFTWPRGARSRTAYWLTPAGLIAARTPCAVAA